MKRLVFLSTAFFAVLVFSTRAQDLVVNVNLTMVDAFVQDQNGAPVLDLTVDDFEVVENGRLRAVRHAQLEREPIALGLLVDRSSSIDLVKRDIDRAVGDLIVSLDSDDQAFLFTFAGTSRLSVPVTAEHKTIVGAIRKSKLGFGSRFFDAFIDSLHYLSTAPLERKALIVFSDGADHYSVHSFDDALGEAARYGYPVYFVGYVGEDSRTWSERGRIEVRNQFHQIARLTGGDALTAQAGMDCSAFTRETLNRLRYRYRLGFYSPEPFPELSDVLIRMRGERGRGFTVRTNRNLSIIRS